MEVLIQHNVRAGLGDYTNGMFRYFHLVDKMRENGFTKIGLFIKMKNISRSILEQKTIRIMLIYILTTKMSSRI
jgi:hypothetical protein